MDIQNLGWVKGRNIDLLVETYSNSARTVQIRGFTEYEQIIADHLTSADRSLTSMVHPITAVPIYLTARTVETSVSRGECFVKVSLRVEGVVVACLSSGYVTDAGTILWPGGKCESSIEGPGLIRSIAGTNPAAGAEISETVPTGARWRLIWLHSIFTCDANVATRTLTLTINGGAGIGIYARGGGSLVALGSARYTWGNFGSPDANASAAYEGNIGINILLPAGTTIITNTINIQVGDDYSQPILLVEEWIEP